jgi:hypothetical protein
MDNLLRLRAFRQDLYHSLGRARDALFELMDAVLTTPAARSFAELSLSPLFRRRWPSLYEALQDGSPDAAAMLRLVLGTLPKQDLHRPVLIGDHTAWPRLSSPTLSERTYEHHPTRAQRVCDGEPITRGFGYATLALVPGGRDAAACAAVKAQSWVLPLLNERIGLRRSPLEVTAEALRRVCRALDGAGAGVPTSLFDSEYGCARFLKLTADVRCNKLMRLRSNRCLYGAPPPYAGRYRPFKHGDVFKMKDETSWPLPDHIAAFCEARWGYVQLRLWRKLHFLEAPEVEVSLLCVERASARGTRRDPRLMWLAWVGAPNEPEPKPEVLWRLYVRRFAIEHFYRFAKQRLYWTLPRLSTPEQSDRWSRLVVPMMMELYLARAVVLDRPLPWQKAQSVEAMTPGRVLSAIGGVMAAIGTEARAPKRRGKSPGWPKGRFRRGRDRYPVVRKKKKRAETGRRRTI